MRSEDNWLRAHLWASTAVFHWTCFAALMKEHGENGAEKVRQGRASRQRCQTLHTVTTD